MFFKIGWVIAVLATAGCRMGGDRDESCGRGDDCVTLPPDAPTNGSEYGTVQPMTAATSGLASADYKSLLGATTAAGNLGCAVIQDEQSSPGASSSVVYAKIERSSGDGRCPSGAYAIRNDPAYCGRDLYFGLYPGCAQYKQWDASGMQVASRLAIGGYVNVQDSPQTASWHICTIELSAAFAGGVTISKTFKFDYNPYGSEQAFCTH